MLTLGAEGVLRVDGLVPGKQGAAEQPGEFPQVRLGVAGRQAVARLQHDVGQRIDEHASAALDGLHPHALAAAQQGFGQRFADHRAAIVQANLGGIKAGYRAAHGRLPLRRNTRCDQPQVNDREETGDAGRAQEIEHVERIHAEIRRHVHHQQVGRGADGRGHAAEDAGEPHRDQRSGRRLARADRHADQDRQHQDHDRRVVDEGAQHGRDQDGEQQRNGRAAAPQPGEEAPHRFQSARPDETLAHDHQCGYGHQRLVAEAEEKVAWLQNLAVRFEGEQGEADRQGDQHQQAGGLQRYAVAREHQQRDEDQHHYRERMRIRQYHFEHGYIIPEGVPVPPSSAPEAGSASPDTATR